MTNTPTIIKESNHYITRNIAASLGLSIYVIFDTLFISIAAGPLGLTVLNLALPLFSAFNATGLLLGVGGAAYYSLNKLTHPERVEHLFSQLIIFVAGLGILVTILINLFATPLLHLLGANAATLPMGLTYVRIISLAAPFYMANYIVVNFVRNDGNPNLTMIATLTETTGVILVDWLFIFGLGLHMEGAALAVLFSPVCSLTVLSFHRRFKGRQLHWYWTWPRLKNVATAARLGVAAASNELANGVSIYVFNIVLLHLGGNYAVAAYGVISNIAIVTIAIANGVALGAQPLISREVGDHRFTAGKQILNHAFKITISLALLLTLILVLFKGPIIGIFNAEHQAQLVKYATVGLPIYFTSAVFTAINLMAIIFLTAIGSSRFAFVLSFLRGYLILIPMIIGLGAVLGITGVWAAVPITEFLVTMLALLLIRARLKEWGH
ncbi:MATE family efflux transporter [Limosilactobacillus fermentum]|uniref:MATE family efflux transporter n=1 Tax=Limosilactobacillus fermentum TaxID=1613 RepID=UPI002F25EDB2